MINWLVAYYKEWLSRGDALRAIAGWHEWPDGSMRYTTLPPHHMFYDPIGFWLVHISLIIILVFSVYLLILVIKSKKHEQSPQ